MKIRTVLAPVAVGALLLTSCGMQASGGERTTRDVSSDSALTDQLPADIAESGQITVATDVTLGLPFVSYADDNKTLRGLNIDLVDALAQRMGVEVEYVNTPFDSLIPGLEGQRYDFTSSSMLDTAERQEVVDFVDFMEDGSGFLVRAEDKDAGLTLDGVCGEVVGAMRGSFEESTLREQDAKCDTPIDIKVFERKSEAHLALSNERINVFVDSIAQINYFMGTNGTNFASGGEPFGVAPIGFAFPKDSELTPIARDSLQTLIDDGTYGEILGEWGLTSTAVDEAVVNGAQ